MTELRLTENGWYVEANGRTVGPFKYLNEVDPVNVASKLGVHPQEVFMAKMRVRGFEKQPQKDLTFINEDLVVTLLNNDGVRVPASQLYYRFGDAFIIGEITYSHALVKKTVKRKGKDETKEYETIVPVLVWAYYLGGEIVEKNMKPYQMARRLEVQDRPVLVELKARYTGTLETLISLETAQKFVDGAEAPSWRELYDEIKRLVKQFVSFPWDPRLYDVVACWILGTYFSELFSTYPFLYAYGSQGSGKTRLMTTAVYLSRHGFIVTDPSDASLYRVAEAFRPTMGIDESLLGKGAWKLIRTAFKKGLKVPRVEKTSNEEFVLALFETYMPVAFASTERPSELGGSEADEARALFIFMQKAPDPIGRDPEPWDFSETRDKLYLLRLLKANDVLKSLSQVEKADLNLYGHDREVWLPLFTIAQLVGEDVYQSLKEYAEELGAIKRQFQYQEEKTIIGALWRLFESTATLEEKSEKAVEFKASELLDHIRTELEERGEYQEGLFNKYWTTRKIGRILTKMSLFKRLLHGRTRYTITYQKLMELTTRYEYEGGLGGIGGVKLKGGIEEETHLQVEGGLNQHIPPLKNTPPNPPNPPTFSLNEVLRWSYLAQSQLGKCAKCGREDATLTRSVTLRDGRKVLICEDCGREVHAWLRMKEQE